MLFQGKYLIKKNKLSIPELAINSSLQEHMPTVFVMSAMGYVIIWLLFHIRIFFNVLLSLTVFSDSSSVYIYLSPDRMKSR